jgi:hypothetical protein
MKTELSTNVNIEASLKLHGVVQEKWIFSPLQPITDGFVSVHNTEVEAPRFGEGQLNFVNTKCSRKKYVILMACKCRKR